MTRSWCGWSMSGCNVADQAARIIHEIFYRDRRCLTQARRVELTGKARHEVLKTSNFGPRTLFHLARSAFLASLGRVTRYASRSPKRRPILLQLTGNPFGVAGQFHIALSVNRFSLCRAGCLDSAFPIGYLGAVFGGEFLLGHAGNEFQ
jgi:hypothetical protein